MNVFSIVARLTKPVEPKFFESGKRVVKFSIAFNENKETVHYFDCEAWDKTADILMNHTDKGSQVALTGRLKQDRWTTDDGSNRSAVRLVAERVTLLGSKQDQQAAETEAEFEPAPKATATATAGRVTKGKQAEPDYDNMPF